MRKMFEDQQDSPWSLPGTGPHHKTTNNNGSGVPIFLRQTFWEELRESFWEVIREASPEGCIEIPVGKPAGQATRKPSQAAVPGTCPGSCPANIPRTGWTWIWPGPGEPFGKPTWEPCEKPSTKIKPGKPSGKPSRTEQLGNCPQVIQETPLEPLGPDYKFYR